MNLRPLDLGCFAFYMLLLIGTGVYFTRKQKKGLKSYLFADQDIHWIIVAISVLAALFSGITYLGAPAESYYHDLSYVWVMVSFFIATPITTLVFLPFFRGLNVSTAYEYLERRFDRRLRRIASGLFITRVTLYLAMVIYAPALAIMEITAWPLWISVLLTGLAATVYTTLGGMKAVIWTDSLQFLVLCGGILLILGFAIAEVPGGFPVAWEHASKAGRTRFLNFDLDPTVRVTFWGAMIGGTCHNLIQMVTDQISVQRYLTAKSLEECQRALWLKLGVTLPLVLLFYLTGTVLFGYYRAYPDREPVVNPAGQVVARGEAGPGEDVKPLGGGQQNRILALLRGPPAPVALAGDPDRGGLRGDHRRRLRGDQCARHGRAHGLRRELRGEPAVGGLPVPAGSRVDRPLRGDDDDARPGDRTARDARRGLREDLRRVRRPAPGDLLPGRLHETRQRPRRIDRRDRRGDRGADRGVLGIPAPLEFLDDVDPRGGDGGHLPPRPRGQPRISRARPGDRGAGLPWRTGAEGGPDPGLKDR